MEPFTRSTTPFYSRLGTDDMIRILLASIATIAMAVPASATISLSLDAAPPNPPAVTRPGGTFDARCQSLTQFCLIMTGSIGSDPVNDVTLNDYTVTLSDGHLTD